MVHISSKMKVGEELDFEDLANLQFTYHQLDNIIADFAPRTFSHSDELMYESKNTKTLHKWFKGYKRDIAKCLKALGHDPETMDYLAEDGKAKEPD